MASLGSLEALANAFPAAVKGPMLSVIREGFARLRFGAPDAAAVAAENFGGHLVPFTTSGTANGEVAIEHRLDRTPRLAIPILALDTVGATIPQLAVTKAADSTFAYIASPETGVACHLYIE